MSRRLDYARDLAPLLDQALAGDAGGLESYLLARSSLPGPRANLELIDAFATCVADLVARPDPPVAALEPLLDGWAALSLEAAPVNDPRELLPAAALRAYGRVGVVRPEWRDDERAKLRQGASSPRWRSREMVAAALQDLLEADWEETLEALRAWMIEGGPWEVRAVAAAVAEPRLLKDPARARDALELQRRCLAWFEALTPAVRRLEPARGLRKALGYTVSVVVAALQEEGVGLLDRLAASSDPDLQWILRENLRKERLKMMASRL